MNLHEIEEREFGRGPILWDADPDVCCAAWQLGACPHTEGPSEFDEEDFDPEAFSLEGPLPDDGPVDWFPFVVESDDEEPF